LLEHIWSQLLLTLTPNAWKSHRFRRCWPRPRRENSW
jgi:hypothetical protein